jgi:hypothetical protein
MFEPAKAQVETYQPGSIFDFGEERAFPNVRGSKHEKDGIVSSPNIHKMKNGAQHKGNDFSYIR